MNITPTIQPLKAHLSSINTIGFTIGYPVRISRILRNSSKRRYGTSNGVFAKFPRWIYPCVQSYLKQFRSLLPTKRGFQEVSVCKLTNGNQSLIIIRVLTFYPTFCTVYFISSVLGLRRSPCPWFSTLDSCNLFVIDYFS